MCGTMYTFVLGACARTIPRAAGLCTTTARADSAMRRSMAN